MFALDRPDYRHELLSIPLCTQLVRKLPAREKDEWVRQIEREQVSEDVSGLAEWAQARAKTMRKRERYNEQPASPAKSSFSRGLVQTQSRPQRYQTMITTTSSASLPVKCSLCERDHSEVKCPTFLAATIDKRWDIVKAKKVCFGCLKRGHQRRQCRLSSRCGVDSCGKGHHYLLHATEPKEGLKPQEPQIVELPTENKGVRCGKAQGNVTGTSKVALKTVTVPFVSDSGQIIMGLVLLDRGSETTLIRTGFAAQLGIQGPKQNLTVDAVGGVTTTVKSQRVRLPFAPSVTKANVNAWTMKNICAPVDAINWPEVKQHYVHLRDVPVESFGDGTVDVLLGLDAAALMAPVEVRRGEHSEPYAELTPLGWVIAGPVSTTASDPGKRILRVQVIEPEDDVNYQLRKFWDIDVFGVRVETAPPYTRTEQRVMDMLNKTCRRVGSGYELGLLWKANRPPLPDNYDTALKRLESVERRLQREPKLAEGYRKASDAYIGKGFARRLSEQERLMDGERWFLPHHPVISPHKPLPRVVFDSASKHEGICLNNCLETGPSLHNDLPGILLRFREKYVALSGDVSDMFCHVRLRQEDCKYHQYLWRGMDTKRPPDVYEMNCLVFGDKSSPCEANFAVRRTTEDNQEEWPTAAAVVRRVIFLDDLYTSCGSETEAVTLREDVTALMAKGGFPMRKWISSSPDVLATVPAAERAVPNNCLESGELPSGRALGIRWDPKSDSLGLALPHIDSPPAQNTKRGILKKLAGLYDPLGWASPFVIRAKVMLQRTWSRGLGWDDPLPADMTAEWAKWEEEITALKSFTVPRYIYRQPGKIWKQLVLFCDASEVACAAAAYMCAASTDGETVCHLLMAKTRPMPLKTISIPRGELVGCQLAVRLARPFVSSWI